MAMQGPTQQELDALHDDAVAAGMSERAYWQHRNTEAFRGASINGIQALLARISERAPQSLVQSTTMLLSSKIEQLRASVPSKDLFVQTTQTLLARIAELKEDKISKALFIQTTQTLLSKFDGLIPAATLTQAVSILSSKIQQVLPQVKKDPADSQIKAWVLDFHYDPRSFQDDNVSLPTDVVLSVAHGYDQIIKGQFTTTGVLPTGLSLATDYWITPIGDNNFKISVSLEDATAETPVYVDLTAASGGGTHTFTPEVQDKSELCVRCSDGTIRKVTLA